MHSKPEEVKQVSKQPLVLCLLAVWLIGCSESKQVTLEFRIAEDEPAPELTEMAFDPTGERFYLHDEVLVNQSDVDSAFATMQDGSWAVELMLTAAGSQEFEELTEGNVGKRCGMVLNGKLVSAPRIMAPIRVGRAILASDFTEEKARRIAQGLSRP
jgi:preprotein translocase subunit SecD